MVVAKLDTLTYECPYCLSVYELVPATQKESDAYKAIIEKQMATGRCKRCLRRDPNVPTTMEMDGLFTEEDIKNRFFVMKPCIDCGQYSKQDSREDNKKCPFCQGELGKVSSYWSSLRTYRPGRKITATDRKKMGGS